MKKAQKGITLIALIITIVVLIILAVVAVSSIQNDRIIEQSNNVATSYIEEQEKESIQLAMSDWQLEKYSQTSKTFVKFVEGKFGADNVEDNGDGTVSITLASGKVYNVTETGAIRISIPVGVYVEYDVNYQDMYSTVTYDNSADGKYGWRYLGIEEKTGNHLLISTGIPMILNYRYYTIATWWDTNNSLIKSDRAVNGMLNNMGNIPYTKVEVGITSTSNSNSMIGLFGDETTKTVGTYFKSSTYGDKVRAIRTLTLAELNRAVNSANKGKEGYTERTLTDTTEGFKDLEGNALGLFDMINSTTYLYWLGTSAVNSSLNSIYAVNNSSNKIAVYEAASNGFRPVIVLSSDVDISDTDNDGRYEINM